MKKSKIPRILISIFTSLTVWSGNINANEPNRILNSQINPHQNSLALFELDSDNLGISGIENFTIDSSSAWGVINVLRDNSIVIAYQKARGVDGFQAVNVDIYLARSVDGGKTWARSLVAEAPPPASRPDGLFEFSQFRNLSMGQTSNGELIIAFSKLVYVKEKTGEAVIQNTSLKSSFYYDGFYKVLSKHNGSEFSKPSKITISEIEYPTTHYKILNVEGHGLVMSVYGFSDSTYKKQSVGILISSDNGKSWKYKNIATINSLPYGETSLSYFNGILFAQTRNQGDFLTQYYSRNFGESWSDPERITSRGQIPGGVFTYLGNPILVYGSRVKPFGVGAKISRDGGFSYDEKTKVSLVWDSPPQHGGYPNAAIDSDNNVYLTYYTMPHRTDYKDLWGNSEVKLLKFNAGDFYKLLQ